MKKILISFGFAFIGVFILWTLMYWQNSINGYSSDACGKGLCSKELFHCSSKSGLYPCNFDKALKEYFTFTHIGTSILPETLLHLNMYSYAFYGIAVVSFLFQRRKKTKKNSWFITSLLIFPAILIVGIIIQIFSNIPISFFGIEIPYMILRFIFNTSIPPPIVILLFSIGFWFVIGACFALIMTKVRRVPPRWNLKT